MADEKDDEKTGGELVDFPAEAEVDGRPASEILVEKIEGLKWTKEHSERMYMLCSSMLSLLQFYAAVTDMAVTVKLSKDQPRHYHPETGEEERKDMAHYFGLVGANHMIVTSGTGFSSIANSAMMLPELLESIGVFVPEKMHDEPLIVTPDNPGPKGPPTIH